MSEQYPHAEPARRGTGSQLSHLSDECLITSKPVREICGNCSEMHIWRLLNEEKYRALAFPKPIKINGRNYWRLGAVRQWIREREVQSQAASTASSRAALMSESPTPPCSVDSAKQKSQPLKRPLRRARSR
jgi:predicted DNA-binding transcriptional regulator AlpA